jgi:hypoxanthine phosphoribosyltransferase
VIILYPAGKIMAADEKYYFSYSQIHKSVRRLAEQVQASGYRFDLIVAIATGGFIPARILKTFLKVPILTVGISYYDINNQPTTQPQTVQWIDEVEKKLTGKRILLVDEVDDSRITLEYCLRELLSYHPADIAVAVLHNKRKPKGGSLPDEISHYFAAEELEDRWICYPWDAEDIDNQRLLAEGDSALHPTV